MLYSALHLALLLTELLILVGVSSYLISLSYSWIKGAPYVGTQTNEIDEILKKAGLKKDQIFLELGCGDGRVVKRAVLMYKVRGIGIDINPFLIWYCRISAYYKKLKHISFFSRDVLNVDFRNADYIYIFLFPSLVRKLQDKIFKETKKNVVIISHGFRIEYLSDFLIHTRKGSKFSTYYYRLTSKR